MGSLVTYYYSQPALVKVVTGSSAIAVWQCWYKQSACCPQIGFLGPAFFLTQLGKVSTVKGAVGCMMACQGLDACSQSGLYSNHQVTPFAPTLRLPAIPMHTQCGRG